MRDSDRGEAATIWSEALYIGQSIGPGGHWLVTHHGAHVLCPDVVGIDHYRRSQHKCLALVLDTT